MHHGVAIVSRRGIWPVSVVAGSTRCYHALPVKLSRVRRCGNRGAAVIFGGQHAAIAAGRLLMLGLHGGGRDMVLVLGRQFPRRGPRRDATGAAVVADIVDRGAVDDRIVDVGVVNHGGVHIGDGGVVVEGAATPFASNKSYAAITEAIINSAVEAHMRSPISSVPEVRASTPAPISGGPEEARRRGDHPRARHPVVSIRPIGPVARRPNVARCRAYRLNIDRQSWRTDVHGDPDGDLRGSFGWNYKSKKCEQKQSGNLS